MHASIRACLMDFQDGWAADDQIAFALAQLAASTGAHVIDPLQATQAIAARCASSLPAMPRADCKPWQAATAVCLKGHWVTFHWSYSIGRITAWSSDPSTSAPDIDLLHSLFAQAVKASLRQFKFAPAATLADEPGQCGWLALQALADRCQAQGSEEWVARVIGDFQESLLAKDNVRAPVLLGGSPLAMLERGLADLLKDKGVPAELCAQRARDGINRIGAPAVQHAMQGTHPWRQLKQVANQASPVFQWVLPCEMQAQIQARVDSGVPLPAKKKPAKKSLGAQRAQVQPPVLPQPEQFQVPRGLLRAVHLSSLARLPLRILGHRRLGLCWPPGTQRSRICTCQSQLQLGHLPLSCWVRMTSLPLQRMPRPSSFLRIALPQASQHSSRRCLFN